MLTTALEKITFSNRVKSIKVIFAGSVLSHKYIFKFHNKNIFSIHNFCGTKDHILYFSEMFCLELGMAGKIGFDGIDGDTIKNYYLNYTHSQYFSEKNDFLKKYWIPLINNGESANISEIKSNFFDTITCSKFFKYLFFLLILFFLNNI